MKYRVTMTHPEQSHEDTRHVTAEDAIAAIRFARVAVATSTDTRTDDWRPIIVAPDVWQYTTRCNGNPCPVHIAHVREAVLAFTRHSAEDVFSKQRSPMLFLARIMFSGSLRHRSNASLKEIAAASGHRSHTTSSDQIEKFGMLPIDLQIDVLASVGAYAEGRRDPTFVAWMHDKLVAFLDEHGSPEISRRYRRAPRKPLKPEKPKNLETTQNGTDTR